MRVRTYVLLHKVTAVYTVILCKTFMKVTTLTMKNFSLGGEK